MRHNQRPPLHASQMPVYELSYLPNGSKTVACPDCGRWRGIVRNMLTPHAPDMDNAGRCPGSAQRINFDLDYAEWASKLHHAEAETAQRRTPNGKPSPKLRQVSFLNRLFTCMDSLNMLDIRRH